MWLIIYVTVTETHYLLPNSAQIHCLISADIQQTCQWVQFSIHVGIQL